MAQRSTARRTTRLVIALLLTGILGVSGATTATAGPQDHGRDPSVSYNGAPACNQNSALIKTYPITTNFGVSSARVEVYYSYSCQTNWIRVTGNPAGGDTFKDIRTVGGTALPTETDFGYGSSYSMQVYAPGSTCIEFQVVLLNPNGSHYGGLYPIEPWTRLC